MLNRDAIRDYWIGTAHLALALAHYTLRDYAESMRWCEIWYPSFASGTDPSSA